MQRWFFLKDEKTNNPKQKHKKSRIVEDKAKMSSEPSVKSHETNKEWVFTVSVPDVGPRETVCITGNIPELGEWKVEKLVSMEQQNQSNIWSLLVTVPNQDDVMFRYCVCIISEEPPNTMVRRWETNLHPRVLKQGLNTSEVHSFGDYDGKQRVTRGWLTTQTLVQFKFVGNPLKLKSRLCGRLMNIKVTPVQLTLNSDYYCPEDSLNTDQTEAILPPGVTVEVATLDNEFCQLQPQEQFGRLYKPNDYLIVNIIAPDHQGLAYLIDFYSYSTRAAQEDPPCHVGYTYVMPTMFKPSEGNLELPVTCNVKHRPLGTVNIEYLIIQGMEKNLCDFKVSYAKHWDPSWTGLEVGHRGLGASFKTKEGTAIRENTIASLKKAATSGADLLEFDVQLSKDKIPVIYHDFHVCISMKRKKEVDFTEMLELPVKDLTLSQLQKLKVYHLVEGRNNETRFFDEDLEEHQPFPTLEQVLKSIDDHVGFNVELKWTMELNDGTFELNNPFDMNTYVDKVLEVVLQHAGERRIVISCFNPDICTMVRNKQNKYPVMFLTVGKTERYPPYRDSRCLSIPAAVQNAVSTDILGIVVHTEDLLRDPSQVNLATDAGLVIFCWGDDNNDTETIKRLKEMGLHAVIYDKLDKYTTKEVKESIFLVEARESQKDLIRLAALDEQAPSEQSSTTNMSSDLVKKPFLNLSVRKKIAVHSTVTSLESLVSAADVVHVPDRKLKRGKEIIDVDKDSQHKKSGSSFLGVLSGGESENIGTGNTSRRQSSVQKRLRKSGDQVME